MKERESKESNKSKARSLILAFLKGNAEISMEDAIRICASNRLPVRESDLVDIFLSLKAQGIIDKPPLVRRWVRMREVDVPVVDQRHLHLVESGVVYDDWAGLLPKVRKAYDLRANLLLVGEQGTGKTQLVRKLSELTGQPLFTLNGSVRTRETHFLGRPDTDESGKLCFKLGPLPESMKSGGIFYFDEMNVVEEDVLLRLDEALDDRRQITVEGEKIQASPNWMFIASINPTTTVGTKELPPQILSRFAVTIDVPYPDLMAECRIMKAIHPDCSKFASLVTDTIKVIQRLRTNLDLPYRPGIRESAATIHLLCKGESLKSALTLCVVNKYSVYGELAKRKVEELITSMIGRERT